MLDCLLYTEEMSLSLLARPLLCRSNLIFQENAGFCSASFANSKRQNPALDGNGEPIRHTTFPNSLFAFRVSDS